MTFGGRCRIPDRLKMEVCVSIINSRKQKWQNVGDTNFSLVFIKPHRTMSMGFVDQNTVEFQRKSRLTKV